MWLQAKYERDIFKHILIYVLASYQYLNPCIEILRIFLNFGKILAIGNLKKHLISALVNFFDTGSSLAVLI